MVIEKITKTYSVRTIYGFIKAMLILIFAIYFAIVTYSSNIVPISYAASLIMLIAGIWSILFGLRHRRSDYSKWWLVNIIEGSLTTILSIYLIFVPITNERIFSLVLGSWLIMKATLTFLMDPKAELSIILMTLFVLLVGVGLLIFPTITIIVLKYAIILLMFDISFYEFYQTFKHWKNTSGFVDAKDLIEKIRNL